MLVAWEHECDYRKYVEEYDHFADSEMMRGLMKGLKRLGMEGDDEDMEEAGGVNSAAGAAKKPRN